MLQVASRVRGVGVDPALLIVQLDALPVLLLRLYGVATMYDPIVSSQQLLFLDIMIGPDLKALLAARVL
jgi:hypothetical protein